MPGNDVCINGVMNWYVGDSNMDELIEWLDKNGIKEKGKCVNNKKNEEVVLVEEHEQNDENAWPLKNV